MATRNAISTRATPTPRDAISLLQADPKKISALFTEFERPRSTHRKRALVAQICQALAVHAALEEEIFRAAVKAALKDEARVPDATVGLASVKDLIAQVQGAAPDGETYDARVKVMREFVKHPVKEEQNEVFSQAARTRLVMVRLRDEMLARQEPMREAA